jgi:predicted SnoaL-like aldol condensation-catalyzing enzyme
MNDIERNKQVVRDFCEVAFNAKNPADAAQRFIGTQYIQHNPSAPDGKEGFVEFATGFVTQTPGLNLEIRRMVAEGDVVVAHSLLTVSDDDAGTVVVDIFRLEDHQIVEHWDVMQPFPETSLNDHPMF